MVSVYCFDIDHTIEVSAGPVKLEDMVKLKQEGHVIGLCGNWGLFVNRVQNWDKLISIIGPGYSTKNDWLAMMKGYLPHIYDHYVLVGNCEEGKSQDCQAAQLAGWEFIKEDDFAAGKRV